MSKKGSNRHDKKDIIKILAICPRCEKEHYYTLTYPWLGNGKPRFYCSICQQVVDTYDDPVINKHNIYY